jgi:predicted dehydrogenase
VKPPVPAQGATRPDARSAAPPGERKVVRLAVIGCGRIAQQHLAAISVVAEAKLTAVVDVRPAAAAAVAEQHRCEAIADYKDARLAGLVDAVLICTPPQTHLEIARHFIERGIHVMVEKPLTIRPEDARAIVKLAAERGRVLMMASKFRYVPDVMKAKSLVESGALGRVVLYENSFCSKVAMGERWNAQPDVAGGGVLIDNGCHSADIFRYLLGPIAAVHAYRGLAAQALPVEDTVRLQFKTASGALGAVDLSWSLSKEADAYISIYGTQGTLFVGWKESRYRQDGSPNWIVFGNGYDKVAAFRGQIENFVGTIEKRDEPLIKAEDALASVEVVAAAYESMRKDDWVAVGGKR